MARWQSRVDSFLEGREHALLGQAALLTDDPDEARELVTDALVAALSGRRASAPPARLEAVVRTGIVALFVRRRRRRLRFAAARQLIRPGEATLATERPAADDAVRAAILALPEMERACVVLRFVVSLEAPAIARTVGTSEFDVRRLLGSASARLTPRIGPFEDDSLMVDVVELSQRSDRD